MTLDELQLSVKGNIIALNLVTVFTIVSFLVLLLVIFTKLPTPVLVASQVAVFIVARILIFFVDKHYKTGF